MDFCENVQIRTQSNRLFEFFPCASFDDYPNEDIGSPVRYTNNCREGCCREMGFYLQRDEDNYDPHRWRVCIEKSFNHALPTNRRRVRRSYYKTSTSAPVPLSTPVTATWPSSLAPVLTLAIPVIMSSAPTDVSTGIGEGQSLKTEYGGAGEGHDWHETIE